MTSIGLKLYVCLFVLQTDALEITNSESTPGSARSSAKKIKMVSSQFLYFVFF